MCYSLSSRLRACAKLLGLALLLLCVPSAVADPKPLTKEEQAKVDQAIDKGVEFLKKAQMPSGMWRFTRYEASHAVGTCALPAYALLESGVAADDPVIQKAAKYLRTIALRTEATYDLSLALLFFDRLGDPQDKKLIQTIALHVITAQCQSGGWSYGCGNARCGVALYPVLLNCLEGLDKRRKKGSRLLTRDEALRGMELPPELSFLTVFQRSDQLTWEDRPQGRNLLIGVTDNSNTEFALLGLWAARRHDVPVEATLEISVERFERFHVYPEGTWTYRTFQKNCNPISGASMTCVGLMGLAMGRALKLPTPGSPTGHDKDVHVLRGLAALSRMIGKAHGDMSKKRTLQDLYFLWSVERVAMLYDLPTIREKDWYRWGAEVLVSNQKKSGCWPRWGVGLTQKADMADYGASLNTAFALLFLKRSHPMKDVTPKLPFTAKELNEGIARLGPREKYPLRPMVAGDRKRLESTKRSHHP
ncbi:MAG TPA: hypothetical protein VMF69_18640 [Gemmataceae bacterium]|nr:hypothetical protein [Gemmataceae bacterium]